MSSSLQSNTMSPLEKRSAIGLGLIYATRMLGLFMILPVFVLYADELSGYTPALAGLAIGIYGLTQATLQIPFGMLSDRIGRKPVIAAGLIIFAIGSIVAASSDSIHMVIAGRAIQGAGAIAAAIMALAADLTSEDHRIKAMAFIGMSIGTSFMLSLIIGPVIAIQIGLSGIFWFTAIMAMTGLIILFVVVPHPPAVKKHHDVGTLPEQFIMVLKDRQLLRLDAGILILHFIMTATFISLPVILRDQMSVEIEHHYLVYLGVLVASIILMVPFVIIAEKYHRLKQVFSFAVLFIALSEFGLSQSGTSFTLLLILLISYFAAFNILEATLPSLVSRIANPDSKGTAMGVYSTSQFLGAFAGGTLGGWFMSEHGPLSVFILCGSLAMLWLLLAITMKTPAYLSSRIIKIQQINNRSIEDIQAELLNINGVEEAVVILEESVAYLKVNRKMLINEELENFSLGAP